MKIPAMLVAAVAAILACVTPAWSADLNVITTVNIRPALDQLHPIFESTSGHKIIFISQGNRATQAVVEGTAPGDVVIASRPMLESLAGAGHIRPGSIVDLARSSIGIAVRAGSPEPDVSTDEKFRSLLLGARSIAYPDPSQGSMGGNYFAALIRQWGIADQVNAKSQLMAGGDPAAHTVADGKADFAINQVSELMFVPGVKVLGPLPPVLRQKITMSAAILTRAREPDAAAALISFLAAPEATPAFQNKGMER